MPHLLVSPFKITAFVLPGRDQVDAVAGVFSIDSDELAHFLQTNPKFAMVPYVTTDDEEDEDEDPAPARMPKFGKMKKADLASWLEERGVEFSEELNKNQLEGLCIERFENPPAPPKTAEE